MMNRSEIIHWARDCLSSKGYTLIGEPEIIQETPWSNVLRLATLHSNVYLKQPVPLLAREAEVIEFFAQQFNANVPCIIANNKVLHCFLMKDCGVPLRKYIDEESKADLLCQAIKCFTAFQRATEDPIDPLLKLDIQDWRLTKLPLLYEKIINDREFLKADGLTDKELDTLDFMVARSVNNKSLVGFCANKTCLSCKLLKHGFSVC